ncbi:unnamed protein product, partial [marine sediment metagenome]
FDPNTKQIKAEEVNKIQQARLADTSEAINEQEKEQPVTEEAEKKRLAKLKQVQDAINKLSSRKSNEYANDFLKNEIISRDIDITNFHNLSFDDLDTISKDLILLEKSHVLPGVVEAETSNEKLPAAEEPEKPKEDVPAEKNKTKPSVADDLKLKLRDEVKDLFVQLTTLTSAEYVKDIKKNQQLTERNNLDNA